MEVLDQAFKKLFFSNLMCALLCSPYFLFLYLFCLDRTFLYLLLAIIPGGALAGPGITCMIDTILRALRDEGGLWSLTWKKAWRQNAGESIGPGIAGALLLTVLLLIMQILSADSSLIPYWILLFSSLLLMSVLLQYYLFQTCTMSLSAFAKLKNSILFFFLWLPRSLSAGAFNAVCILALYAFLPYSLFFIALLGFSLPLTASSLMLYAPFERKFDLEAKIKKLN